MVEVLKQGQYEPLAAVDQALIIFAGTRGHMDKVPVKEVSAWERGFLAFMREQKPEICQKIRETRDLDDATASAVGSAIGEYQAQYESAKRSPATARG